MPTDQFSIAELADAAGVSRRAIRFYVSQGLLPAPAGLGRGKHYGSEHRQQLSDFELQTAGHSLDAIRKISRTEPPLTEPPLRPHRCSRLPDRPAARCCRRNLDADHARHRC